MTTAKELAEAKAIVKEAADKLAELGYSEAEIMEIFSILEGKEPPEPNGSLEGFYRWIMTGKESPIAVARREAAVRNARDFGTDPSWYGQ